MRNDRGTKVLLALIAIGLWALVLEQDNPSDLLNPAAAEVISTSARTLDAAKKARSIRVRFRCYAYKHLDRHAAFAVDDPNHLRGWCSIRHVLLNGRHCS